MLSIRLPGVAAIAAGALVLGLALPAAAQKKDIVVGSMCDRTGATQTVGVVLCPGASDWKALAVAA